MSFTIDVLHAHYPDSDPESDQVIDTIITLGPYRTAYVGPDAVYGDYQRVAFNDEVNPGMWVQGAASEHRDGDFGLVPANGFHIKEA